MSVSFLSVRVWGSMECSGFVLHIFWIMLRVGGVWELGQPARHICLVG